MCNRIEQGFERYRERDANMMGDREGGGWVYIGNRRAVLPVGFFIRSPFLFAPSQYFSDHFLLSFFDFFFF